MSLTDLASVLWRSRELLEMLLFKLEEEQLLLASNRSRWLSHATREVDQPTHGDPREEVRGHGGVEGENGQEHRDDHEPYGWRPIQQPQQPIDARLPGRVYP